VAGLVLYGAVAGRLPRRPTYIVSVMATGMTFWALAIAPGLAVAAAFVAVGSLLEGPLNPIAITVIHERVPPELHGRIIGAARSVAFAVAPLGALAGGAAVQVAGLEAVLIGIGVIGLAATGSMWLNPVFRQLRTSREEVTTSAGE
jgi:MFS family permease